MPIVLILISLDNQNPRKDSNQERSKDYYSPKKMQKQDENGPGVAVSSNKIGSPFMNHSTQGFQEYARNMHADDGRQQLANNFIQIPLQSMSGDGLKHGTGEENPLDPRSMLPGPSHAQNRFENVHASESKDNESDE